MDDPLRSSLEAGAVLFRFPLSGAYLPPGGEADHGDCIILIATGWWNKYFSNVRYGSHVGAWDALRGPFGSRGATIAPQGAGPQISMVDAKGCRWNQYVSTAHRTSNSLQRFVFTGTAAEADRGYLWEVLQIWRNYWR